MVRGFCVLLGCVLLSPARAEEGRVRTLIEHYGADFELLARHYDVAGNSAQALARHKALLDHWLAQVGALDFTGLSLDDRVDAILLRNAIERSLLQLEENAGTRAELAAWVPFRSAIDALADARVRGEVLVPEKAASALAPVAKSVTRLHDALKAAKGRKPVGKATKAPADVARSDGAAKPKPAAGVTLPTAEQAWRIAAAVEELGGSLKRWFDNYHGFVPEFSWWVKEPYDASAKALADYAKYLREEIAGVKTASKGASGETAEPAEEQPLLGRAVGAEQVRRFLDHEFIPYSPDELLSLAEREFRWCEEQLKSQSREMKLGEDWKKALQRVKQQYVKPGEQEAFIRAEGKRAIAFVKDRQLVAVPSDCEEWWGTHMLSLPAQRSMPYAAYGGHDILVAYANEAMKHEDKLMAMRGNNRAFTRNVVPHELIPGHHLQSYMAAREHPYRRLFTTPFFVEGWALYWEMRLWDLKYQATPEDRIGALFWRMHRCARIIVTLKFHLGAMKPEEMVKFLVEKVGHEKFGATSEVRRFIAGQYAPLYQCGYMLGGLQLRSLHREITADGRMTEQAFHDAVLKLGPIPVELVRASLLHLPLEAGYRTQWRFDTAAAAGK